MRRAVFAVLAVFVLVTGWWLLSPYFALRSLGAALKNGDRVELEDRVDFAHVREDLKAQLGDTIAARAGPEAQENPFAALALVVGQKLADVAIDALVTPDAIARLAEGEATPAQQPAVKHDAPKARPFDDAHIDREGLNRFSAWVPTDKDSQTRFVFRRAGFGWVLTNIRLGLPGSSEEAGAQRP